MIKKFLMFNLVKKKMFLSGGADGSVRLFDLRNLDHSTIIYETKESSAINKLAWNLQTPNLIAALSLDKNVIYIFDSRMNCNVSLDELKLHSEPVTGCVWAPDTPTQLCSVSEDCSVIISNVDSEQSQNSNVSYMASFLSIMSIGVKASLNGLELLLEIVYNCLEDKFKI